MVAKKRFCGCPVLLMLVAFIVASVAVSCGGNREADRQLSKAEEVMAEHPDLSLSILTGIDHAGLGSDEERARYALLMSQALDKNYVDTTTFDVLQPAIDYYPGKGSPDERLKTHYYQGRIYQNQGNLDEAMRCFINGMEYRDEASDSLAVANLLVAQATILYQT